MALETGCGRGPAGSGGGSGAGVWDGRYAGGAYVYGVEPNDWLRKSAAHLVPVGKVLSLGEGEGRNGVFLAGLGHSVTAVDQSGVGLAKARALAAARGVPLETVQADLGSFDPGVAAWDGVLSLWCHLPSALRRKVHARAVAALKPGGWLLLEAYAPEHLAVGGVGGPKDPDYLASLESLKEELSGLKWEVARSITRGVSEGELHQGESAVVQLLGRKE